MVTVFKQIRMLFQGGFGLCGIPENLIAALQQQETCPRASPAKPEKDTCDMRHVSFANQK